MSRSNPSPGEIKAKLESLRGDSTPRPVTARVVASQSANTRCGLLTLANASGVRFDRMLQHTEFAVPYGQARSAITRGNQFEGKLKAGGYAELFQVLREAFGIGDQPLTVRNLKEEVPHDRADPYGSLGKRADLTREIIKESLTAKVESPHLIDGAILRLDLGGQVGYLETDALALRLKGKLRVGEIKSFPAIDGRADPAKVGSAADQSAVYVLALENLVRELGGDPEQQVSSRILLITPRNTGMRPTVHEIDVSRRVSHHRRQLEGAPDLNELLAAVPSAVSFPSEDGKGNPVVELGKMAAATGTCYSPTCLSFCGLSRWCRHRASEVSDPTRIGPTLVRLLPGVASLERARELAGGAAPTAGEEAAAEPLRRAERLLRSIPMPPRKQVA